MNAGPKAIVFAGPPCSGKSTLAAEVSRLRRIPHLSMDATRERILPNAAHTRDDREAAYRAMHFAAELLLDAGASIILDAPYGHPEDREEIGRIAGGRLRLIECRVSPETAIRRFRARGPDPIRLDLTGELVERMVREYPYRCAGLTLETEALSEQACLVKIFRYLDEP
jgi:predicted kinase